jgi:hypothetical protein
VIKGEAIFKSFDCTQMDVDLNLVVLANVTEFQVVLAFEPHDVSPQLRVFGLEIAVCDRICFDFWSRSALIPSGCSTRHKRVK